LINLSLVFLLSNKLLITWISISSFP